VESGGEKISFESKQARAQAVAAQGARLTDIVAGAIRVEASNGRTRANASKVSVGRVEIAEGQISGFMLQNFNATLNEGRYQARGNLGVKSGALRGAAFGPLNGELMADNGTIALNKFKASLFGGSATGDVAVQTGRGGASRLKANFTGVKTGDIFTLF